MKKPTSVLDARALSSCLAPVSVISIAWALHDVLRTPASSADFAVRLLVTLPTIAMSAISIALYCYDKVAAILGSRYRVSERTLHLVSLLGGWPGASVAQQVFQHKCSKRPFLQDFLTTVVVSSVLYAGAYKFVSDIPGK